MFFRTKSSGPRTSLQVVENRWEGGRSRQRVVATLGRLDQLRDSGQLDALLISGARLAHSVMILAAHAQGRLPVIRTQRIGPALIIERLWQQTGCQRVIQRAAGLCISPDSDVCRSPDLLAPVLAGKRAQRETGPLALETHETR